jgi:hypothetical protein
MPKSYGRLRFAVPTSRTIEAKKTAAAALRRIVDWLASDVSAQTLPAVACMSLSTSLRRKTTPPLAFAAMGRRTLCETEKAMVSLVQRNP